MGFFQFAFLSKLFGLFFNEWYLKEKDHGNKNRPYLVSSIYTGKKSSFSVSGKEIFLNQDDMCISHKMYRITSEHMFSLRQFYSNDTNS